MVDLKSLEKEIDKLFESETTESLTSWLLNNRTKRENVDKTAPSIAPLAFNLDIQTTPGISSLNCIVSPTHINLEENEVRLEFGKGFHSTIYSYEVEIPDQVSFSIMEASYFPSEPDVLLFIEMQSVNKAA